MSEAKLYRPFVSRSEPRAWLEEGTPLTVENTPMVRWGTSILPAAGWHATKADAQRAAAEQLEQHVAATLVLINRLRQEVTNVVD